MTQITAPAFVDAEPVTVAVLRDRVPMDALNEFYDRVFGVVAGVIAASDAAIAGPALGVYYGAPTDVADVAAGFPISGLLTPADGVEAIQLPTGRVARLLYTGPYDGLADAFGQLYEFMTAQGEVPGDVMWEQYLTEPAPDADLSTMQTLISWTIGAS